MITTLYALLLVLSTAQGVIIQSEFLNTFIANGSQGTETLWQQRTITLECSNQDSRDTSIRVGNVYYDVACHPPKISYKATLRGFVPHVSRRVPSEFCEDVQGISTHDASLTIANTSTVFTSRRLLNIIDDIGDGISTGWHYLVSGGCDWNWATLADVGIIVGGAALTTVSGPAGVAVASVGVAALADGNSGGCGGGSGPVPPPGPDLAVVIAHLHTLELLRAWVQNQLTVDQAQARVDVDLLNTLNMTENALKGTQLTLLKLNQTTAVLAETMQEQMASIKAGIDSVTVDLDKSLSLLSGLSARQQLFFNITMANFRSLSAAFSTLSGQVADDFYTLIDRDVKIEEQVRQLGRVLGSTLRGDNVRRVLTRQTFSAAEMAVSQGLTPFWDVNQPGVAPSRYAKLSPAERTVQVDVAYVNFINGTSPTVHQLQITYSCNMYFVTNSMYSNPSWTGLLSQLGPLGCASMPGTLTDNCNCWIQINHTQCAANTAGHDGLSVDFNWQQIPTPSPSITDFILDYNPAYCQGQGGTRTSTGAWNGVLIDNPGPWNALLSQLCGVKLSDPIINGGPTGVRQMQLISSRIGTVNVKAPSNPEQTCKPNYDYIFKVAPESNIIFTITTYLQKAQNIMLSDQKRYEQILYGVPPNLLTYDKLPFQLLSDNRTYTCHRTYFLGVSEETRPLFEPTPQGIEKLVTIAGYNAPPVCDDTGCVFGQQVTDTQATSDVLATIPFSDLLPDSSDTIVGEWRTHGTPTMTQIADVPRKGAPLTMDRRGTMTYILQPIPDGYTLKQQTSFDENLPLPSGGPWPAATLLAEWNSNNPFTFSALDADLSVDQTEVDFVNGRCQPASSNTVSEWACNMFDHFQLDPLTDMRQGVLVLTPREWSYIVTLNINQGELAQRVYPGCPELKVVSFTNGYQEVTIFNSLPNPVQVVVHFTLDTTSCPAIGDMRFQLQPKQTVTQIIFGCPQATVIMSQITENNKLSQCGSSLNISYVANAQSNVPYFTDDTATAPVLSTAILDRYVQQQTQFLNVLKELKPFIVPSFTPQLTTPERSTAIQQILRDFNQTLVNQLIAARTDTTPSAAQSIAPLLEQTNQLQRDATKVLNAAVASEALLKTDLAAQIAAVARQKNLTNETRAAIASEMNAINNQLQQLSHEADGSGSGSGLCGWCSDWLNPHPSLDLSSPRALAGDIAAPVESTLSKFICPILCGILKVLITAAIAVALGCCCYQGVSLCCKVATSK